MPLIAYFLDSVANPRATVCGVSVATSYGDAGTEGIRFARDRLGFTAGPLSIPLLPRCGWCGA